MSVSKYNKTTGELVTLASGVRMWVGTKTAHDLAVQQGTMPNNVMVCITDDYAESRTQFSGSIGSISSTSITTLKSISLPVGKTIIGTMTVNLGSTNSTVVLNLWARVTSPTTVDSSEVVASARNDTLYTQLTCPFCFTNTGDEAITVYLGYYQGIATYTATVRATYTIM